MAGIDLEQFVSAVVGSWDGEVLQSVDAQIRLGHEYAYLVLFAAPTSVAWKQPEAMVRLLRGFEGIRQEYLRSVQEPLKINILPETKFGTPGEPFPETCEQISRCKQIAENYRAFESIKKFYTELAEMGEREAQRERRMSYGMTEGVGEVVVHNHV